MFKHSYAYKYIQICKYMYMKLLGISDKYIDNSNLIFFKF